MKHKKLTILIILFSAFFFLFFAYPVLAENNLNFDFLNGIVPCGRGPATDPGFKACTVCDFFKLIQNIINFFLFVSVPLVTLAAIYIGFLFLFSGGSSKMVTMARTNLGHLVWGVVWVFGSWLVLNTILNVVANPAAFPWPWSQVQCSVTTSAIQTTPAQTTSSEEKLSTPILPKPTLSEQEARDRLQQAGISVNKSACPTGVSYQNVPGGCTSLEGIKTATIEAAIELKKACNCPLEINGGTELGHAKGVISHGSGNKLDFNPNPALDKYIRDSANYIGKRDDGAQQYRDPIGTLYARESNHWDVLFVR